MMKRKMFLLIVLGLSLIAPLITSAYEDGFYGRYNPRFTDENGNRVITAIYGDIELTIKADDQPGMYYWGWNEPSVILEDGRLLSVEGRERDTNPTYGLEHNNDWGGGNDTFENGFSPNPTNFEERQGPCDDGYHVPSKGEWRNLVLAWGNLRFKIDLDLDKDPFYFNTWQTFMNELRVNGGNYWTSSPMLGLNDDYAWMLTWKGFDRDYQIENALTRGELFFVRCFKNEVVYPAPQTFLITFLDESGSEIVSGSVESGAIWTGTVPDMTDAKEGRNFLGRYDVDDSEENIVDLETFQITKDTVLRAKFEIAQFTISFVDGEGNVISEITQDYDTDIQKPTNPTKNGYEFVAWDREIPEKMPAENLTITAQWKKKSGGWSGGGGGGGGMKKDNCPGGDFSPSYYDGECGENNHGSADDSTGNQLDSSDKSSEGQTGSVVDSSAEPKNDSSVSSGATAKDLGGEELFNMHQWAYDNGLTIYKPGEDAKFDQPLTRQQMAKISSIFGAKFLNQKADDSEGKIIECSQYKDLSKSKGEMRGYVIQSCLMKNMGYAYDNVNYIPKFKPYDKLSVAQASVILSRMAWGTKYVISPKMWYQGHMKAVYDHGLIDDVSDPKREITRGEAFMMMYRLDKLMNESEK